MSLSRVLESRFRGDIRFRGQAYVSAERVEITHVTEDRLYGVVHDSEEFQTQLSREESTIIPFCTCAKPGQEQVTCKHVWATIIHAEAEGYINGGVKPGYFPPFVVKEDEDDFDIDAEMFEELLSGDVYIPSPTARKEKPAEKKIERPLAEWERRLKTIRDELDEGDLAGATSREREIVYLLDLPASREHGQIVVDVMQRQARGSGGNGRILDIGEAPINLGDLGECGTQLRPNIVWFGEEIQHLDEAVDALRQADRLVVVGTSLTVQPAAGMISQALRASEKVLVTLDLEDPPRGFEWRRGHAAALVPPLVQEWLDTGSRSLRVN